MLKKKDRFWGKTRAINMFSSTARSNAGFGGSQSQSQSRRGSQQPSPARPSGTADVSQSGTYANDANESWNYNNGSRGGSPQQRGLYSRPSEDAGNFNSNNKTDQNSRARSNVSTLPPMSPTHPNNMSSRSNHSAAGGSTSQSKFDDPSANNYYNNSNSGNNNNTNSGNQMNASRSYGSRRQTPDETYLNANNSNNGSNNNSNLNLSSHEQQRRSSQQQQRRGSSSGPQPVPSSSSFSGTVNRPEDTYGARRSSGVVVGAGNVEPGKNSRGRSGSSQPPQFDQQQQQERSGRWDGDSNRGGGGGQGRGSAVGALGYASGSGSKYGSPLMGGSGSGSFNPQQRQTQHQQQQRSGRSLYHGGLYRDEDYQKNDRGFGARDRNFDTGIAKAALEEGARTMKNAERYDSGGPASKIVIGANEEILKGQANCCVGLGGHMCVSKPLYLSDKGIEDLADEVLNEARKKSREVEQLLYLPSAAELAEDKKNREEWDESDDDAAACRNLFHDPMPCCPWVFDGFTLPQFLLLLFTLCNILVDCFGLGFCGSDMVSYMVILRTTCISCALALTLFLVYMVFRLRGGRSNRSRGNALSTKRKGIERNNMTYSRLTASSAVSPAVESFMVLVLASFFDCAMLQLSHNSNDVIKIGIVALTIRLCCFLMHFIDFAVRPDETLKHCPQLLYAMIRTWTPGAEQVERIRNAILKDYKERYAFRPLAINEAREALIRRIHRQVQDYKDEASSIFSGRNEPQAYDKNGKPISRRKYRDMYGRYPPARQQQQQDNNATGGANKKDGANGALYQPTPYVSASYPDPFKTAGSVAGYPYPASTSVHGTALASKSRVRVDPTLVDRFRRACHAQLRHYLVVWIAIMFVILICLAGNVSYELWRIYGNQPPFFWTELNDQFLDRQQIRRTFPSRVNTGLKVQLLLIDGLGYDMASPGASAFSRYFDTPSVSVDTLKISARSQMPSFGIPNGYATISGAPPELTGIVGDYRNGESDYDNIFSIAYEYGVHTGVAGSPPWTNLIRSWLPTLGGEFSVKWDARPPYTHRPFWTSADPSDRLKGRAAVQAARRSTINLPFAGVDTTVGNLYELFVTQLEDVQLQGYRYGVSSLFNKGNLYQKAIGNSTLIVENIMNAIDDNTVLIVTSSNGQVPRGGSGGESKQLRNIPIFMYRRNSGAAAKAAQVPIYFPSDNIPKSTYLGRYTNMDLAATMSALLGLPTPRQSLGIFVEEALGAFLPNDRVLKIRYYHDLLLAKINLMREYQYLMENTCWSYLLPKILRDPDLMNFMDNYMEVIPTNVTTTDGLGNNVTAMNVPYTEEEYAALVRVTIDDYWKIRNARYRIIMVRNMLLSLIFCTLFIIGVLLMTRRHPIMNMGALLDRYHPSFASNWAAFLQAFFSIAAYVGLSVMCLFILYYGIERQPRWDLTNISYPFWLGIFAIATMVVPIFWFTIITKFVLARFIRWKSVDALGAVGARTCGRIFWFFAYLPHDLISLCFVTWRFKPNNYHQVLLYSHYFAFFTVLTCAIVLFMAFPYAFVLPCVLDNDHVQVTLSSYRFRMVSINVMMLPLIVGSALMLVLRPRCPSSGGTVKPAGTNRNKAGVYPLVGGGTISAPGTISAGITVGEKNSLLWDQVWLNTHLKSDDYYLSEMQKDHNYVFKLYEKSSRASARLKRKGGMTAIVHPSDPLHDLLVNHTTIKVLLAMLTREREKEEIAVTAAEMSLYVTGNVDQIPNLRLSLGLDVDATNIGPYPIYPTYPSYPGYPAPHQQNGQAPPHPYQQQYGHHQHQQQQQGGYGNPAYGNHRGNDDDYDDENYQYKYPIVNSEKVKAIGAGPLSVNQQKPKPIANAESGTFDGEASTYPYGSLGDPHANRGVATSGSRQRDSGNSFGHNDYEAPHDDHPYYHDEEDEDGQGPSETQLAAKRKEKKEKRDKKKEKKSKKEKRDLADDTFGASEPGPEERELMEEMQRHFDSPKKKKDRKSKNASDPFANYDEDGSDAHEMERMMVEQRNRRLAEAYGDNNNNPATPSKQQQSASNFGYPIAADGNNRFGGNEEDKKRYDDIKKMMRSNGNNGGSSSALPVVSPRSANASFGRGRQQTDGADDGTFEAYDVSAQDASDYEFVEQNSPAANQSQRASPARRN